MSTSGIQQVHDCRQIVDKISFSNMKLLQRQARLLICVCDFSFKH